MTEYVGDITKEIIRSMVKLENEMLEKAVRENATPEIKGAITKGKLKWRGIKLICKTTEDEAIKWVEQRGVQISPKISINLRPSPPT